MNQDGTFETLKELYQALFNGETVINNDGTKHRYNEQHGNFEVQTSSGAFCSHHAYITFDKVHCYRILKPKKRRVIKDYKKLGQVMLDLGYLKKDGHFENQWLFSIAGEPVDSWGYTESGKSFAQMYHDYRFHAIPFEMTEEYDDDE